MLYIPSHSKSLEKYLNGVITLIYVVKVVSSEFQPVLKKKKKTV